MKLRQTFTLSPEVTSRAKLYARNRGMSLSALVEELLKEKTKSGTTAKEKTDQSSSFSHRWVGKGAVSPGQDERTRKLRKKYDL